MAAAKTFINYLKGVVNTLGGALGIQMDPAFEYKAGQLIKFNTGTLLHEPALLTTDGNLTVGVLLNTNPPESATGGSNEPFDPAMVVQTRGIYSFFGKNGETYFPYSQLVIDAAGAQVGQSLRLKQGGDAAADVVALMDPNTPAAGVTITASGQKIAGWLTPEFLSGANAL